MKKFFINKYFILGAVALVIVLSGFFVAGRQSKFKNQTNSNQNEKKQTSNQTETQKGDNAPNPANTDYQPTGQTNPTIPSTLGTLNDVSLTVYLLKADSISQDGKTYIPAGSISPSFYMESGVFTVQKMVNGSWQNVATNINYPGHGGLSVSYAGPTEDNINYRVLKMDNNTAVSTSKTFLVKRSDLTGGMKTYN